eukprot:scaffold27782_cov120-Skeletonema_menzelii.AAC.1
MADSPPSVRMLGNVTAAARPPSIPSDLVDISASQRPEEQDAIERTGSTIINGERNMSISMTSEDGGNESSSAKRNLHPSIMHKPKVESASGEALSEKEQIISRNDKLHQFEISEEIKDSLVAQQNIYNEGEADETSQLRSIDESSENNATQAQENEENNTFIDSFEAKIAEFTASLPPNSDVVLSLNDQHYKSVMWLHYKELGRNRDSAREAESADQVFQLFQQHMGTGKFYKLSPFGEKILVSEKIAYDKIIADVRRRLVSYKHWSIGMEGTEKKKKPLSAPIVRKKRERPIENNSYSEELIAPTSP